MLVVDANVWVAAFDPADGSHSASVEFLAEATRRGLPLRGPAYLLLEAVCTLTRRLDNARLALEAGTHLARHPALRLEPLTAELLHRAHQLGAERRLLAAEALYAAIAAQLECQLVSLDENLIARAGALAPAAWIAGKG